MPDWGRRRFIGASIAVVGVAATSGVLGRGLLDRGRLTASDAGGCHPGAGDDGAVAAAGLIARGRGGISPLVTPNRDFYRIDTALLVPRPDVATWRLSVTGMVDRPFELTYDELVALPLHEQYVTIACVSNEVGGDLVGNALWTGVRLKELLERAGVHPAATQIVGRAVDGFTVGFPTAHAIADDREPLVAVAMNGEPLPANHGYPARLIVPGPLRLRQRHEVADGDRAHHARGVRRVLGPARLGEAGADPDAVTHRRAQQRRSDRRRAPSPWPASRGRRTAASARSRCRSTRTAGSRRS